MKKFLKLIVIFALIGTLSILLAPIVFKYSHWKFERIISRLVMIFTLAAIFIFKRDSLKDLPKYGFRKRPDMYKLFLGGFMIGFIVLFLVNIIEILMGGRQIMINISYPSVIFKLLEFVLACLIIGIVEEFFFRGYIFINLKNWLGVAASLIITNFFYAMVHFLKSKEVIAGEHPGIKEGFLVFIGFLKPLLNVEAIYPAFIGLFIFGMVLSYAYIRSKSLYLPIGIHAGCVFFLKTDGFWVEKVQDAPVYIYGGNEIYAGIIGWAGLIVLLVFLKFLFNFWKVEPPGVKPT